MRQLWDGKMSAQIEAFTSWVFHGLRRDVWMAARASAHARSGGTRVAIASYLGTSGAFEEALATFAEAYADQNEPVTSRPSGRATVSSGMGPTARDRDRYDRLK